MSESPPVPQENATIRWLTLKEASDFLGVHFSTLRVWADRGDVRVFRTPGGHRRFSLDDLRRFLDERHGPQQGPNEAAVMETALVRVRQHLERTSSDGVGWRDSFHDDQHDERRRRGRQLFSLALAFVLKPGQRERLLAEGRLLGLEYGGEAARNGVNLADSGRAVQFFRGQLVEAVHHRDAAQAPDAEDLHVEQLIDRFLDEVLYAVLEGYEAAVRGGAAATALEAEP